MTIEGSASGPADVTPAPADSAEVAPVVAADAPAPAAPDSTPVALVEPAPVEPAPVEPAPVEPALVEPPAAEPVHVAPVAPVPAAVPVAPAQQVVYVQAPKPFVAKGNRGFGVLIALVSTIIFAALYAAAEIVGEVINGNAVSVSFITTLDFYAPVVMFAIGFILLVLIVNRAGWAAHVLGSIFVGLLVFFGGTGIILLLHINQIPSNEAGAAFRQVLFSVGAIIAGLLAREVALWMGFAISSRGRRVKARNVEARALYDQEIADKRAEYERANARTAAQASATPVASVPVSPVQPEPSQAAPTQPAATQAAPTQAAPTQAAETAVEAPGADPVVAGEPADATPAS